MDPYETLGITPAYSGDLRALRNRLVKRYFEAGESPDEERMKAINVAYAMLLDAPPRPVAVRPLTIVSSTLPPARLGEPYRVALAVAGGVAPYAWEAVLPRGLALDGEGVLSGRVEHTLAFTLRVTDRDGRLAERGLVVPVEPPPLRVTTEALPPATIGVPYSIPLDAAGGVAPLRWSGELPAGLQLGDGLLFGTPVGPSGARSAHVHVRDAARQTASVSLPLVVEPPAAIRERIAVLERRLARRSFDPAATATALVAAAAAVALLPWFVGLVTFVVLVVVFGPWLLAPGRRAELERLRSQ